LVSGSFVRLQGTRMPSAAMSEEEVAGEAVHLIRPTASCSVDEDNVAAQESAARMRRAGCLRRLAILAAPILLVTLVLLGTGLGLHSEGLKSTLRSGDDLTKDFDMDFDFDLEARLKKFRQKMRGYLGTCLSGTNCANNTGAVRRACKNGRCKTLLVAYCCTSPKKMPRIEVKNHEITCTCRTTSKTFQSFKDKIKSFEKGPMKMWKRLKEMGELKPLAGGSQSGDPGIGGSKGNYAFR